MARRGGWRRVGSGQRFRYEDSRGKPITDEDKIRRIEELVIPPAWRDVWISPRANAKLQAVGVDAAGRRQYLYHPEYRATQEQAKYDRLVLFAERLPALRKAMSEHMEHDLPDREHVSVRGKRVKLCFRGKHGVQVRTSVVDEELADSVRGLLALKGGGRLFRYEWEGARYNLTGKRLNDYVRIYLGEEFTAKDFRTWGGTLEAAIALAEANPAETETQAKKTGAAVMRRVAERLGNTPAV